MRAGFERAIEVVHESGFYPILLEINFILLRSRRPRPGSLADVVPVVLGRGQPEREWI
jgi:hypothetical protein